MYRIAMMVLRLFLKAPYYLFRIWMCGRNDKISFEEAYAYIKKVTIAANKAGRVKIESYGLENIPEKTVLYFFLIIRGFTMYWLFWNPVLCRLHS